MGEEWVGPKHPREYTLGSSLHQCCMVVISLHRSLSYVSCSALARQAIVEGTTVLHRERRTRGLFPWSSFALAFQMIMWIN